MRKVKFSIKKDKIIKVYCHYIRQQQYINQREAQLLAFNS